MLSPHFGNSLGMLINVHRACWSTIKGNEWIYRVTPDLGLYEDEISTSMPQFHPHRWNTYLLLLFLLSLSYRTDTLTIVSRNYQMAVKL